MNPLISSVLILQERDTRVTSLLAEVEKTPREIASLEREAAGKVAAFEELKAATRQIEADRKKLDLEVQSKQGQISRYKTQQQQTRKNEEYAALDHEIHHAEAEISALEDRELELMEAYEKGQARLAEAQKELQLYQEKAKQKKADLEKRGQVAAEQLKLAQEEQTKAEADVPPDALARYRRILKSKKDVAIVPIQHGACGACHMKLTAQTVISAQKTEDLTSCENCGRLVFWPE